MIETKNAIITNTSLGPSDRGIFSAWLYLEFGHILKDDWLNAEEEFEMLRKGASA